MRQPFFANQFLRGLFVLGLIVGWISFLIHPWSFHLWCGPVRWPVEAVWVLGWIITPLYFLCYCLIRLSDAIRG